MSKTVNKETTFHLWDGSNIVADLNSNFSVNNKYLRGINLIKNRSSYYLSNAHGDVVQLANASGAVSKSYKYDDFGVEIGTNEVDSNPFRYCSEYFDKETNSIYLRARYYSPATGRFYNEDPIRDGLNWYTYTDNNPTSFIDPLGLERIAVSGSEYDSEDRYKYNFIESAIKQILDWLIADAQSRIDARNPDLQCEPITWIISKSGYSDEDINKFNVFAETYGINLVYIENSHELYNYINSKDIYNSELTMGRTEDKVTQFSVFSHGLAGVVALGYRQENSSDLAMTIENISVKREAFDNVVSIFYSCNTGTGMEDSFAQAWVNNTGGSAKAVVGGTTTYRNMNIGESLFDKFLRRKNGFNYGSQHYPEPSKGVSWHVFYPNK